MFAVSSEVSIQGVTDWTYFDTPNQKITEAHVDYTTGEAFPTIFKHRCGFFQPLFAKNKTKNKTKKKHERMKETRYDQSEALT